MLTPAASPPTHAKDCSVPLSAASSPLVADLRRCVPDGVDLGVLVRHALAADASHFLLLPRAVLTPRSANDVAALLGSAHRHRLPVTFRSGGTSLSGQSVTDGLLVDVRRHFKDIEILSDGLRVRVQPGVTVRQLNARLAPFGRRFGPDPASEAACTVGGVLANNSSGMVCGTQENSYRTLESVVAVLPSGTVVDTGAADADDCLRHHEPNLYEGLSQLRDRIRTNPTSVAILQRQFAMKNTMGYGLNTFLDHDSPTELLARLLVGSEGTLAFVAQATFRTVPLRPAAAAALLVFDDLYTANRALPDLVATQASTLELMDATSLRVGQALPDCPPSIKALTVHHQAALLVEYQASSVEELADLTTAAGPTLKALSAATPGALTQDRAGRAALWKLRKGLYTSVAGARPAGTTALLEDVVVPVPALADTCAQLTRLFTVHGYENSVIFGHAKDGNIHFMLTDRFEGLEPIRRFGDFTDALVDLVLGQGGSLKAEHGTGRVMAPYVRRQYGDELYEVMTQLKDLCDPHRILNPGVVLNDDPIVHLKNIKLVPPVEAEVDRCVECGYCEPVCPSRDLTLTPRQRIVARRAIRTAEAEGDQTLAQCLTDEYGYPGVQTCAVDGMCQTACPVLINTGDLVRGLRQEAQPRLAAAGWAGAARRWDGATRAGSLALSVAKRIPGILHPAVRTANQAARTLGGSEHLPLWSSDLPAGGRDRRRPPPETRVDAIYLPACVNRMFGPADHGIGVQGAFEAVCAGVGVHLMVPGEVDALCCGTPWSSKGMPDGYAVMRQRLQSALRPVLAAHPVPLVTDASSCTEGLKKILSPEQSVAVMDAMTFTARYVLPKLGDHPKLSSVTIHPTCSSTQLGLNDDLIRLASEVAAHVHIPTDWACCAFAGDRGMLHPELTASATAAEAAEVQQIAAAAHASCNRTCELGMTRATGRPYRHVIELLADLTSPVDQR